MNPRFRYIKKVFKKKHLAFYLLAAITFAIAISFLLYSLLFWGKIFPQISVAGVNVGGLKPEEAETLLKNEIRIPQSIILTTEEEIFELNLEDIEYEISYNSSAYSAYHLYRTGNVYYDTVNRLRLYKNPKNIGLVSLIKEPEIQKFLSELLDSVETDPIEPSLKLKNQEVTASGGTSGVKVNVKKLRAEIDHSLSLLDSNQISIPITPVGNILTESEISFLESMGKSIVNKEIDLQFDLYQKNLSDKEIIELLDPKTTIKEAGFDTLSSEIKNEIEREPQNSILVFEGGSVKEFVPSKEGVSVNEKILREKLHTSINNLINTNSTSLTIDIPVTTIPPEIKTEDVNDLGIRELIGRGTSRFSGSISTRIHNIEVASSKFNGVLVKPNEIVSFNDILGDVSSFTGYKKAYIIKDGKTVLGDGGGVCQVSTTLFRAILDTGLPTVERRAHSYRVGYYEQSSPIGLDATVYAPTTDLKFKNDTDNHILIQTEFIPKKAMLIFEIYGTSDGRIASTTKPVISNVSAPPEDLYIDDPTLPVGTIKQIDYKAWGAKANFTYSVKKEGEIIFEKTYYSNYQPWQAKFLKGTAPIN